MRDTFNKHLNEWVNKVKLTHWRYTTAKSVNESYIIDFDNMYNDIIKILKEGFEVNEEK